MESLREKDEAGPSKSNSKTEQTKYDRQISLSLSHYDDATAFDAQIAEAMDKEWQEQADAELARSWADQF
ncbi:hypothetical protein niasHT_008186 [Heterodera trifolii]|uniref:Uncharacterized protein n=1 Tax=Heterodera trifolii TaxID=157864 RepID=A0ABD2LX46_9BILA